MGFCKLINEKTFPGNFTGSAQEVAKISYSHEYSVRNIRAEFP